MQKPPAEETSTEPQGAGSAARTARTTTTKTRMTEGETQGKACGGQRERYILEGSAAGRVEMLDSSPDGVSDVGPGVAGENPIMMKGRWQTESLKQAGGDVIKSSGV